MLKMGNCTGRPAPLTDEFKYRQRRTNSSAPCFKDAAVMESVFLPLARVVTGHPSVD
jgi:hypothetical protein